MNQEKSINLFLQGKDAWNIWAERLLRRKKKLIDAGEWFMNREFDFEAGYYRTVGLNDATASWLDRAYVDFSCLRFIAGDEASNKSKARNREEKKYIKSRDIPLEGMNVDFRGYIFPSDLRFDHSEIHGIALFNNAEFHGSAWFSNTAFLGDCWFEAAGFKGLACFHQADFASFTTFALSRFDDNTNFEAIRAGRSFDLSGCRFQNEVPDFIDADFERPPRLSEIIILPPPTPKRFSPRIRSIVKQYKLAPRSLRQFMLRDMIYSEWIKKRCAFAKNKFINTRRKRADEAHFSALRKVANEAKDYASERKFFAGQVRARRHLADQLKDMPTGALRYISGALYEVTSNFGRSLWRPAIAWMLVFYIFTGIYWLSAPAALVGVCQNTPSISPMEAAKTIASRNAFFIFGENAEVDVRRAKHCLSLKPMRERKYLRLASPPLKPEKDQSRLALAEPEKVDTLPRSQGEGEDRGLEAISSPDRKVAELAGGKDVAKQQYGSETLEDNAALDIDAATEDITGSLPGHSGYSRLGVFQMILHVLLFGVFIFVLRNQLRLR